MDLVIMRQQLYQFQQSHSAEEAKKAPLQIQVGNSEGVISGQFDDDAVNQVEMIINRVMSSNKPPTPKSLIPETKIEDMAAELRDAFERKLSSGLSKLSDDIQQLRGSMISTETVRSMKEEILKFQNQKEEVRQHIDNVKVEMNEQIEKVERMWNKLTVIQSDSTIQSEYTNSQLKRLFKDKENIQKILKHVSQLTAVLSETSFIAYSIQMIQELERRATAELFDNSTVVQQKFFTQAEGVIFEINSETLKTHPGRLTYRSQIFDKTELLRSSMSALVNTWEAAGSSSIEEISEISPGKVFKSQMAKHKPGQTQQQQHQRVHSAKPRDDSSNNHNRTGFHNKEILKPLNQQPGGYVQGLPSPLQSKHLAVGNTQRKPQKTMQETNQAHLANAQKQITTPYTLEKQKKVGQIL